MMRRNDHHIASDREVARNALGGICVAMGLGLAGLFAIVSLSHCAAKSEYEAAAQKQTITQPHTPHP